MGQRIAALAVCVAAIHLTLTGCAVREWQARRAHAAMLDPDATWCESLCQRQRLRSMVPESDGMLADAFFPIGLYDVPESALHEVAAAGFNLVVNGGKDGRYLARAESAGLKVIPYINHEKMARDVRRVQDRPAVLAWYLQDEPDLNKMPPERYEELAHELRRHDSTRPIYLTVWSPRRYADFMEWSDVFAPNPYPILNQDPLHNNLMIVAMAVEYARATAGDRPVWAIVQAFWAEPLWPRNPTPAELRAMVFLALNHGADGIIYFSYKSGDRAITAHPDLFTEIRRINGHIRALRGALLKRPLDLGEAYPALPPVLAEKRVDLSVRRFRDATLLMAVNPDPAPKSVELDLGLLGAVTGVSELFPEGLPAPEFTPGEPTHLTLPPFGVRILWLE